MTFNRYAKQSLQKLGYGLSARRSFWRFITGDHAVDEPLASRWRELHRQLWEDYRRLTGDQQSHCE